MTIDGGSLRRRRGGNGDAMTGWNRVNRYNDCVAGQAVRVRLRRGLAQTVAVAIAGVLLSACALTARPVQLDPEAVATEAELQRKLAVEERTADQRRLQAVSFRVLTAAADFCPDSRGPLYGVSVATRKSFGEKLQPAAESVLSLDDTPRITAVAPGSPAEKAGLLPGDAIVKVGETEVPPGDDAQRIVRESFRRGGLSATDVELGGQHPRSVTMDPVAACDYRLAILPEGKVNAYTNGRTISVTKGMLWFARDDNDLALVLSHEVAHNILGHTGLIATLFVPAKRRETDADYLGLYIMARAGYDLSGAPAFWRRVATAFPKLIDESESHPVMPDRFVALRQASEEIRRRKAAGLPLAPERIDGLGISGGVE